MSDASLTKSLLRPEPEPSEPADTSATPPAEHPAAGVWRTLSGLRKLQLAFSDPRVRRARSAADVADAEARQLLALRLKRAKESAVRTEVALQKEGARSEVKATTDTPSASGLGFAEAVV